MTIFLLLAVGLLISVIAYVWIVHGDDIADALDEIRKNEDENGWF